MRLRRKRQKRPKRRFIHRKNLKLKRGIRRRKQTLKDRELQTIDLKTKFKR